MELPEFLIIPTAVIKDIALTPLDGQIYGIIYWYTKLKLQKCIIGNQGIADMLSVDARSVQRSLARLSERKYIKCIYNPSGHRTELIPMLTFQSSPPQNSQEGTTLQSPPHDPTVMGVRPYGHHNKINIIRRLNKTVTNVTEEKSSGKSLQTSMQYGKPEINDCLEMLRKYYPNMTNIERNRYAFHRMLKKIPKERILKAIEFSYNTRDEEYAPVITNGLDLEKKWDQLETFARRMVRERRGGRGVKIAVMPEVLNG